MPRTSRSTERFSRRERQIMDIIYRAGSATAADVMDRMPDAPGYSAVRALLRILENKGHLTHQIDGTRYVYRPTASREKARRSALEHMVTTFFEGSATKVVSTLLDEQRSSLSDDDLNNLSALIERARKEGR